MTEYEKEPCFVDDAFDNELGGINYIMHTLTEFLKSQPHDFLTYKLMLFKESTKDGAAREDK